MVLLTALLVIALCACNRVDYSKPIEAAIQITYYGNEDYIEFAAPEEYFEWYEDEYGRDFDDYCDDWENDWWAEEFGRDYKVTYKISNEGDVDEETLDDIRNGLENQYNIDSSDVKAAYLFDIEYLIEGSKGSDSSKWKRMYSVKIRDDWYLVRIYNNYIDFCYDAW